MKKDLEKFSWEAPEFLYEHKDISWYWLTIIGAGIIFLISVWQGNLLFGLFIIIAEIMLIAWAKESPRILRFTLDHDGIHIDKIKSYTYDELAGFHIHENSDDTGELILKTKVRSRPVIKILSAKENLPRIKEFLSGHLTEIEYKESLVDSLEKMIGF